MPRRSNGEVSMASVPEVELGSHAVDYIGTVPVNQAMGKEVCREAVDRMLEMRVPNRSVTVTITNKTFTMTDKKTGTVMKIIPIVSMSFVCNPNTTKELCVIEQGTDFAQSSCHGYRLANKHEGFQMANEIQLGVRCQQGKISVDIIQKVAARGKGIISNRFLERVDQAWYNRSAKFDRGAKLQVYRCHYYGTSTVENSDAEEAEEMAETLFQRGTSSAAELVVYENAIELINAQGRVTFQFFHVSDIHFAKQVNGGVCFTTGTKRDNAVSYSVSALELAWGETKLVECLDSARLGTAPPEPPPRLSRKASEKSKRPSVSSVDGFGNAEEEESSEEEEFEDGFGDAEEEEVDDENSEPAYLTPVPADRSSKIAADALSRARLAQVPTRALVCPRITAAFPFLRRQRVGSLL
jgi:hypothetical protein